jgi:alpha-beta hydrolase superfamily lysophospholipase
VSLRWRWLLRTLLSLGAAYAAVLVLLAVGQEKLLFAPRTLPAEHRFDLGPDVEEVWVDVDGARLNALHLRRPGARGVVFYLHGNAGHLQSWFVNLDWWRRQGVDLFMLDYRGFGKSGGRIQSEAQLHADVRAAWDTMLARYGNAAPPVRVLFGRSLGTGLALHLAPHARPDLSILVSPYLSLHALAGEIYPWVPRALLRYPMRSDRALAEGREPVLILHGDDDALIPPEHGQRLAALAPERARFVLIPGADHNDLQNHAAYLQTLERTLAQTLNRVSPASPLPAATP